MKSLFISYSARWLSLSLALGVLTFALPVNAQTGLHSLPTHHVPKVVLNGKATAVKAATPTKLIHLDIVLPLRNQTALQKLLKQLYEPGSPKYRQFLNVNEFTKEFGPTPQQYQAAANWAKGHGFAVGKEPTDRLIVPITGKVADVESAFHLTLMKYQLKSTGRLFYAPDREPTVDLSVPLWHIAGLSNYSIPRPLVRQSPYGEMDNASGSGPSGAYLPSDMRAAYYGSTSLTGSGQCVGLAEFDGYNISDLTGTFDGEATASTNGNNYTVTYNPPDGSGPYTIPVNNVLVDGGSLAPLSGDTNGEAEVVLDIAQAIGMAPGVSQVRVYIAPDAWTDTSNYVFPSNSADTDIFNQMVSDNVCKELSISWNWAPENLTTDDGDFEEMQALGQSFFAASGDSGSWPNDAYYYPEEDPLVTTVGGTDLTTNGSGGAWASETAWSSSGGGVSPDDFAIPQYQKISGFGCSGCSASYRNAPDIAMEANFDNYVCAFGQCAGNWGGTSFAAPRWAGLLALANEEGINEGVLSSGQGLGFINPTVYNIGLSPSYSCDFHDITSGSNGAYSAAGGYDLVTGWGSPKGQYLIESLVGQETSQITQVSFTDQYDPTFTAQVLGSGPSQLNVCAGSVTFSFCSQSGGNCTTICSANATGSGPLSCQNPVNNESGMEYTLKTTYSGSYGFSGTSTQETVIGTGYSFSPL